MPREEILTGFSTAVHMCRAQCYTTGASDGSKGSQLDPQQDLKDTQKGYRHFYGLCCMTCPGRPKCFITLTGMDASEQPQPASQMACVSNLTTQGTCCKMPAVGLWLGFAKARLGFVMPFSVKRIHIRPEFWRQMSLRGKQMPKL